MAAWLAHLGPEAAPRRVARRSLGPVRRVVSIAASSFLFKRSHVWMTSGMPLCLNPPAFSPHPEGHCVTYVPCRERRDGGRSRGQESEAICDGTKMGTMSKMRWQFGREVGKLGGKNKMLDNMHKSWRWEVHAGAYGYDASITSPASSRRVGHRPPAARAKPRVVANRLV